MFSLALSAVLIANLAATSGEDRYDGRTVDEWRELIGQIEFRDSASRQFVPGLIALMDDPHVPWTMRRLAALALGRLGPLAVSAIPQVAAHLDEIVPDDPETSPQRWALSSLALFGRDAKTAAPDIIRLLEDPQSSWITKLGSLEALSQIGSAEPAGIRAMIAALESRLAANSDEELELARGAAEALGFLGADATGAVPVLMRATQSPDELLRHAALVSLGKIGSRAYGAQPLLIDFLTGDDSPSVRDAAATALGQIGPSAWLLVSPLLHAEESELRERALHVVANWPALQSKMTPEIEPLLNDQHPRVRLAACRCWWTLTRRHERVWLILVELLTETDRSIRRGASLELQAIVKTGVVNDDEIRRLAADPRPAVQNEALRLQQVLRRAADEKQILTPQTKN